PFAALPGKKAEYLLEELAIGYAPSGRHLLEALRPLEKAREARGLVVVGGVDYGPRGTYEDLPCAADEARRCRDLFQKAFPKHKADLLSGKGATLGALKEACEKGPRHLHLATHGFFEPPDRVQRLLTSLRSRSDRVALWEEQTRTLEGLP